MNHSGHSGHISPSSVTVKSRKYTISIDFDLEQSQRDSELTHFQILSNFGKIIIEKHIINFDNQSSFQRLENGI